MIEWNKVTLYSKLAALILFVIVLPTLGFYIGTQYAGTQEAIVQSAALQRGQRPPLRPNIQLVMPVPPYSKFSWNGAYGTTKTFSGITVAGVAMKTSPVAHIQNIAALTQPFYAYYNSALIADGWSLAQNLEADGAGSSIRAYQKGNKYIFLAHVATDENVNPAKIFSCPCTIQFGVLIGQSR